MLAQDEIVHHPAAERPGPVEGHRGDDIVERGGHELAQQIPDAPALKLENAQGAGLGEQLVGIGVIERNILQCQLEPSGGLDELEGVGHERQGL